MTAEHAHEAPDGVDESTPLVGASRTKPRRPRHRPTLSVASLTSITIPKAHDHTTFINLLCLLVFAANTAGGFADIPQVRLIEDAVCQQYYDKLQANVGPIDEELCKIEPVQTKVAFILAILFALTAIVGFCSAFPWSVVADRIGRKPVMALGVAGISLSVFWSMLVLALPGIFPVSLVWLGSLTQMIGGGNPVLAASILSMLTDATGEGERAVVFLRLHVASLCGNLFSPSLASLLMERTGPWVPLWLGAGLLAVCAVLVLFLPETLKSASDETRPGHDETSAGGTDADSRLSQLVKRFQDSISILRSPSLILLLVACLVTTSFNAATSAFMVQFVSQRYDIKLEQGGYIQSFYGVAQAIQSIIILPWLAAFVMRNRAASPGSILRPTDTHHRDLHFLRVSSFIIVLASFVLGIAPSLSLFIVGLVIMALGTGFSSLIRTLVSLYVDPEHRSRLFGIVSMVEIIANIYSWPMLAGLFSLGMKLGGQWIGLPYYGVTALSVITTILFLFVKVPHKVEDPSSVES